MAVAEWLEMLATVSKVLGSIPGEVTKILPECRRLVISVSLRLGDTFHWYNESSVRERPDTHFDISYTCLDLSETLFISGTSRKPCSRQKFSCLKYSLSNTGLSSLTQLSGIVENPVSSLRVPPYSIGID